MILFGFYLVYFSFHFGLLLPSSICVTLHCHQMLAAQLRLFEKQPYSWESLVFPLFSQIEVRVFCEGRNEQKDRNGKRNPGTHYKVLATSLWPLNSAAGLIFEL